MFVRNPILVYCISMRLHTSNLQMNKMTVSAKYRQKSVLLFLWVEEVNYLNIRNLHWDNKQSGTFCGTATNKGIIFVSAEILWCGHIVREEVDFRKNIFQLQLWNKTRLKIWFVIGCKEKDVYLERFCRCCVQRGFTRKISH
jgi:hypothetical protein